MINNELFVKDLQTKLLIPDHVAMGVQWRTWKNENKKQCAWDKECPPPQGLHFEMDHKHGDSVLMFYQKYGKKVQMDQC